MARKTVRRADGKGVLTDANGNPWPASAFENEPTDKAFDAIHGMTDDEARKQFGRRLPAHNVIPPSK